MQSKPISIYIYFGTSLRYLQDVISGVPVHGKNFILDNIDDFLTKLSEFILPVTKRASSELQEFKEKLEKTISEHKLTPEEQVELREIMGNIRETLFAEAAGNFAFIVTDKRIDVDKLLYKMEELFAPNVFNLLPEVAKYDFNEAGKCIAFERSTAAAFHLLRGTEDVLKKFYCFFIKRNRAKMLLWGPMVESLRKHRKRPPDYILNNLNNIRQSYRNPTDHPEKIYDIQEAQDLCSLCIEVVNKMIKIMEPK